MGLIGVSSSYLNRVYMDYWQTYQLHYLKMNKNMSSASYEKYDMSCIEAYLPMAKDARLLDIGCGVGMFVYYLQKKGYANVEGVDVSEGQIRLAAEYAGVKLKLHVADSHQFLSNKVGIYNQIYLIDVLEHIKKADMEQFLSPIVKGLKGGGSIVIRTPNMANLFGVYSRYLDMTHETAFTEYSLVQLMIAMGARDFKMVNWSSATLWPRKVYSWVRDVVLKCIFRLENRAVPSCFDANLLMVFYF